jgi:hypothetical protein
MQRFPLDSYAYSLARVRWDVFGTLTFRSVPSPKRAYGRAWALMRLATERIQRPYSQLTTEKSTPVIFIHPELRPVRPCQAHG